MSIDILFVIGFPRSGTTLLTSLLNKTGKVSFPPETRFYEEIGVKKKFDRNELVEQLKSSLRIKDLITECEIENLFKSSQVHRAEALESILAAWSKSTKIVGEKSPIHQLHLDKINNDFPNSKVIYIIRDPRDCINSVINANWGHSNIIKLAVEYRYRSSYVQKKRDKTSELLTVKFEDLVENEKKLITIISRFLFKDDSLLNIDDASLSELSIPEWESKWKKQASGVINRDKVEVWKNSKDKLKLNKKIAYEILNKACVVEGYEEYKSSFLVKVLSIPIYQFYFLLYSVKRTVINLINKVVYLNLKKGNNTITRLKALNED